MQVNIVNSYYRAFFEEGNISNNL